MGYLEIKAGWSQGLLSSLDMILNECWLPGYQRGNFSLPAAPVLQIIFHFIFPWVSTLENYLRIQGSDNKHSNSAKGVAQSYIGQHNLSRGFSDACFPSLPHLKWDPQGWILPGALTASTHFGRKHSPRSASGPAGILPGPPLSQTSDAAPAWCAVEERAVW